MKKTAPINTPAKRRLRSRFSGIAPTDAVGTNAPVDEPQPTTSQPEKPAATRSRAKKTNTTRQKKRKGVKAPKPEPVPLEEATPAAPQSDTEGGEMDTEPPQAADQSTPAVKDKVPVKQGTRTSARLRGRNPTATREPARTEPEVKQTKRKRGLGDEGTNKGTTAALPKKQVKVADDQTDTPTRDESTTAEPSKKQIKVPKKQTDAAAQAKSTTTTVLPKSQIKASDTQTDTPKQAESTTSDPPPADLAEDATVDHPEQPTNAKAGASTAADDEEEPNLVPRFFLRKENGSVSMYLGYFPPDQIPTSRYL